MCDSSLKGSYHCLVLSQTPPGSCFISESAPTIPMHADSMPLKRIRSLQYRWLHFLQPDIILTVFSSCSLAATSSLGEAIEMTAFPELQVHT